MDDYPDPDEEFELMYGDELELMRDMDEEGGFNPELDIRSRPASRRSLDFGGAMISQPPTSQKTATAASQLPASQQIPTSFQSSRVSTTIEHPVAGPSWLPDVVASLEEEDNLMHLDGDAKKRKAEELFGDISDIYLEEDISLSYSSKRTKHLSEEDPDTQLMDRIMAGRRDTQAKLQSLRVLGNSQHSSSSKESKNTSVSKRVPGWPFIPVSDSSGGRWYVRLRSEQYIDGKISDITAQSRTMGLLSVPYETLWQHAQEYLHKKLEREETEAFEKRLRALEEPVDSGCEMSSEDEKENGDRAELWVEKYKPRTYLELLSDESTNRTLLHWLKLWDKVVFNREKKVKQIHKEDKKKDKPENRFQKKTAADLLTDNLDEHGRPQHKLALLCGPPGLGKTTLAHMIARHAGYNVVEMNASDDRSPEAFRTQLEAATQMRSVMGQEPRPNCLVLDEIDGAPAPSIEVLVKFATGKDVGKGRGKKKGGNAILKRPLICICNDVYVPALRPLRLLAFVVHFPPTGSSRLAQRLLEIARKQHIKTDLGTLLALADKTHNDIRSCMSVLHFFKSQGKEMKLTDVQQSNVGQKDMQKGLFTVWQEIFQIQRPKRRMGRPATENGKLEPMPDLNSPEMKCGSMSLASRMQSVLQTVQSHGDYDRLTQGVYENCLKMNIKDSNMEGVVQGLEWFCTVDVLNRHIYATQNYILMPYLPFAFVVWHFVYSSLSWPKISYPSTGYESTVKTARGMQLLGELMKGMQPNIRAHTQSRPLLLDTLPLLQEILVPNLRPVSMQLYSARERAELSHVVSIMIDYNLNYIQERTPEGSYVYNLDPNIEELALYPTIKHSRLLSYGGKQLVSREVDLEKMRRSELRSTNNDVSDLQKSSGQGQKGHRGQVETPKIPQKTASPSKSQQAMPNHLQKLQPKVIATESSRVSKDFFGRLVQPSEFSLGEVDSDEIVKSEIWFHFKEGFSNAVRRSVKMHDLA